VAALGFATGIDPAKADGESEAGRVFFNANCGGCHSLSPDTNHYAPNLRCILGRAAGSAPFSAYTEDMKTFSARGLIWDAGNLAEFLRDPRAFASAYLGDPDAVIMMQVQVPGEADRRDVIAYLARRCQ
jgi:cytochrome c